MNLLAIIKKNQNKVSQLDSVEIKLAGIEQESDKALKLLLCKRNGGYVSQWVPKSVIIANENAEILLVKGWFAAKELFGFVDKKLFI